MNEQSRTQDQEHEQIFARCGLNSYTQLVTVLQYIPLYCKAIQSDVHLIWKRFYSTVWARKKSAPISLFLSVWHILLFIDSISGKPDVYYGVTWDRHHHHVTLIIQVQTCLAFQTVNSCKKENVCILVLMYLNCYCLFLFFFSNEWMNKHRLSCFLSFLLPLSVKCFRISH